MGRLRKLLQLSARDRWVLGQAWTLFFIIDLGLRLCSFRSLLDLCRRWSRSRVPDSKAEPVPIERWAWLVDVAGRYSPIRSTCLKQALVLSFLLGRRGLITRLRLGVLRQGGSLKAHAWLERPNKTIVDLQGNGGYEPLLP